MSEPGFVDCPLAVLEDGDLTGPEFRLLLALYSMRHSEAFTPDPFTLLSRAGVTSTSYLSRLSARLERKGWISKKRMGRYGFVRYRLHVPERFSVSR